MREIKFRIYDKQTKQFTENKLPEKHHIEWERFVVSQFTGLKDKNGKEIYENDRYKYLNHKGNIEIGTVEYDEACFVCKRKEGECFELYCMYQEIEIIGNIHEDLT